MEAVGPLGSWKRPVLVAVVAVVALATSLAIAAPVRAEFKALGQWGAPTGGEIVFPLDVDRDNAGNTYALDLIRPEVLKFDAANNHVLSWGSRGTGPGQFGTAFAVGVNEVTQDVYVADLHETGPIPTIRIQHFDSNGNFIGEWGSFGGAEGQFGGALSIAVNSVTGDVFTVEGNRVQRFSSTGQFELMWGKDVVPGGGTGAETCAAGCKEGATGSAEGELRSPTGVATNANQVFVAESGNSRISRFNATTGAFQIMGGADVQPGGGTGTETCVAACKEGLRGSGNGELDETQGIDANGTFVWIVDSDNDRVQRWSNNLAYVNQFGTQGGGDGQFNNPRGLAENGGTVIVTDVLPSRLQTFNGAGTFQSHFAEPAAGTLTLPAQIAAGPGGIYVTDAQNRVVRYDDQGTPIGRWGTDGSAIGEFLGPSGLAAPANGEVYVIDSGNSRVQRFDSSGAALGAWGTTGIDPGQFNFPTDVAVGPDASVYVLESDRVQKFSPIGGFQGTWGAAGDAPGQFGGALGIATDPQGNIYVADSNNDRVQKFNANGQLLTSWGTSGTADGQFDYPRDVAVDGAGNVFVVDSQNNRIQRFTADGQFRDRFGSADGVAAAGAGPGELSDPTSVTVDTHGYVYVADRGNDRVQKFVGTPELAVSAAPRQRLKELTVSVACVSGPCSVSLSGKIVVRARRGGHQRAVATKAKKLSIALTPVSVTLDPGAVSVLELEPAKRGKRLRRVKALLKDGGRGNVTVDGAVVNEAGAGAASVSVVKLRKR
jgi:tripartite motif-containing protein 71